MVASASIAARAITGRCVSCCHAPGCVSARGRNAPMRKEASSNKPVANKPRMKISCAAGSDALTAEAIARRLQPVGSVEFKDMNNAAAMKTGQQVYDAQCMACHAAGAAGAPKTGDEAAWAPRIKTGYDALLGSVLKGKGAMGAQGGGDFADFEVARAVVFLANKGGARFDEPKMAAAAASAPN